MNEYVFTFGFGQPNEGCYTVIRAATPEAARQEMVRRYGDRWSMMYSTREEAGVTEYHLHEILDHDG